MALSPKNSFSIAVSVIRADIRAEPWQKIVAGLAIVLTSPLVPGAQVFAQEPSLSEEKGPAQTLLEDLTEVASDFEIGEAFLDAYDQGWPVITEEDTSPRRMTVPSVWWSRDRVPGRWLSALPGQPFIQFPGYRLVTEWRAFRQHPDHFSGAETNAYVIDIQVDPQYWNRLGGIQQYAVLNQMGTTGMSYGYQVRIYNSINLVGIYACDFEDAPVPEATTRSAILPEDLENIQCAASLGPFIQLDELLLDEDLFAPP